MNNVRLHSLNEIYTIMFKGVLTAKYLRKAKNAGLLDQQFIERIMLAVTEVNGCDICSYAHTKMALESGMSENEIKNMLAANLEDVPSAQVMAIMFAQHYAETNGNPSSESWQRIVDEYGDITAYGILAAIRIIMMGNVLGIPWSAFMKRLKGDQLGHSSLGYELSVMIIGSLMVIFVIFHVLIANLFRIKAIDL
ncbi:MAG: carboxymuconolactone decarboxylase family protein [Erysipelotrichaceae bacterium]|nr:carboxymuconolactone decarboxylase family protein [Erysipelotrichaceae bacterium]MDD3924100.1 carboxymuconolactone decarboxylase family protein [Erysipelotrichaceae bacterium]MDD4642977.1 carboxymuconolactone decarboxylase family protein [Erysipelotrichaceae bacterium]